MPLALGIVLLVATCLLVDFLRRPRSSSLSLSQQLQIYAILRWLDVSGMYQGWRMEQATRNFMKEQRQLISNILHAGRRTQYGRDHGLTRMRTLADFRSQHPVTEYPHYASYIRAMEHGDENVLLADDDVLLFATSSGTTGANKHVPVGRRQFRRILRDCAAIAANIECGLGGGAVGRVLMVTSRQQSTVSASGKPVCSLSPVLQRSPLSRLRTVTPACVHEVATETAACYVGLLFALRDGELYAIFCTFVHVFLRLMGVLESQWPTLVSEIAAGRVGDHLSLPAPLLARINSHLTPAPGRAAQLRRELARGFDDIIPRLWPRLRFVQAAHGGLGGAMYFRLARRYLGDVPAIDVAYCSSEACLGVAKEPATAKPAYTLIPDGCLYEFLPVASSRGERDSTRLARFERNGQGGPGGYRLHETSDSTRVDRNEWSSRDEQCERNDRNSWNEDEGSERGERGERPLAERLLLADQLEVGAEYELVITTRTGLYRYRLGDVVRVRKFHNSAPVVELLYRAGLSLSVQGEKVSTLALFEALQAAAARWHDRTVLEFAAAPSLLDPTSDGETPHQLLFLELAGPRLSRAEADLVDSCLQATLDRYREYRTSERIGRLRVLQMAPGAFLRLRDVQTARGQAHWSQIKAPHVLRRPEDVALLLEHVLPPSG